MRCARCGTDYVNYCKRCLSDDAFSARIAIAALGYVCGILVAASMTLAVMGR